MLRCNVLRAGFDACRSARRLIGALPMSNAIHVPIVMQYRGDAHG